MALEDPLATTADRECRSKQYTVSRAGWPSLILQDSCGFTSDKINWAQLRWGSCCETATVVVVTRLSSSPMNRTRLPGCASSPSSHQEHLSCDRIGQMARHPTTRRRGTGESSDSSQWSRWCGKSRPRTGWWRENRRKRTTRNIQERHDQRWSDFETRATLINLEPHVQSSRVRYAREKCVCACVQGGVLVYTPCRVHACCYWLSAKSVKKKSTRLHMESELKSTWTTIEIFSHSPTVSWGYSERESVVVILAFGPTTLCLATHESAILAIDGPKMTSSFLRDFSEDAISRHRIVGDDRKWQCLPELQSQILCFGTFYPINGILIQFPMTVIMHFPKNCEIIMGFFFMCIFTKKVRVWRRLLAVLCRFLFHSQSVRFPRLIERATNNLCARCTRSSCKE